MGHLQSATMMMLSSVVVGRFENKSKGVLNVFVFYHVSKFKNNNAREAKVKTIRGRM
jgi:hypothetical protein